MNTKQPASVTVPKPFAVFAPMLHPPHLGRECETFALGCPVDSLREALAREAKLLDLQEALLREKECLLNHQENLRSESDHRLLNGLQMVVSLLSLQGRASINPEVTRQLAVAANRVATIERIHRRLHNNDGAKSVAFKKYLEDFCRDFSGIMAIGEVAANPISVEGPDMDLPTGIAIPLGFIVNELVTNAVKYGKGRIAVGLENCAPNGFLLTVSNEGPPLPPDYDPAASKGLGMKIIRSFLRQIDGEFHFDCGAADRGPRFTVTLGRNALGAAA